VNVNHLVTSFGYWAVFTLVGLESLGIPLPGETVLIAAGTYAGHTHRLSVWALFAVAAAAAIIGDNIGFWIGAKGGYRLLRRYGRYIRFDESKIKVGRYVFDRHGGKVVFLGRFVSVLRTYAAFLAGTNRMRWPAFLVFNAAGGIVWAAVYSFGSYFAGNTLRRTSGTVSIVVGIVAGVAIVVAILVLRRQAHRLGAVAEDAYPGPLAD
jgi:membrane protein DedA with SNARE-associated domain